MVSSQSCGLDCMNTLVMFEPFEDILFGDSFLLLISLMIKLKAEKNRRNCRCSLNQRTPAMFTLFIPRKTPRCAKRYISNKEKNKKA